MAAKSTKGTKICIVKDGATGVSITPTGASLAAPSVILTADTDTLKNGDLIYLGAAATGIPELDGKRWIVDALVADTSFALLGSDATGSTGTFAAGTTMKGYPEAASLQCICLSGITFNRDTPDTISTATFCDTTSSIPGSNTSAGSVDFTGYVNIAEADYKELLKLEASGKDTAWRVMLPGNGYIVFDAIVNQISIEIPLEGPVSYSGSATLKSAARHLF